MRRLLAVLLVAALALPGCASFGGPKHVATVSIVGVTSTLELIQQTEMAIVCGRAGAPQAPLCVPLSTHRQISAHLRDAAGLAIRVTDVTSALPVGTPTPPEVFTLMVQVNALIQDVLKLLPSGKTRAALLQQTGLEVR